MAWTDAARKAAAAARKAKRKVKFWHGSDVVAKTALDPNKARKHAKVFAAMNAGIATLFAGYKSSVSNKPRRIYQVEDMPRLAAHRRKSKEYSSGAPSQSSKGANTVKGKRFYPDRRAVVSLRPMKRVSTSLKLLRK